MNQVATIFLHRLTSYSMSSFFPPVQALTSTATSYMDLRLSTSSIKYPQLNLTNGRGRYNSPGGLMYWLEQVHRDKPFDVYSCTVFFT